MKQQLDDFRKWLRKYGRSDGTAELYCQNVRSAYARGGPLKRLADDTQSPKTRWHILAALRAWARFLSDDALALELSKIKLPPAKRVSAKVPLERERWFELIEAIDEASIAEPVRACLGIMACRGLRSGDVLRLTRPEVTESLRKNVLAYEAKGRRRLEYALLDTYRRYVEILAHTSQWQKVEDLISPRSQPGQRRRRAARVRLARTLRKIASTIGMQPEDIHPHRLRRTYATEYLRALKKDPEALMKLKEHMQWADLNTAFGYVDHSRRGELDEVAVGMFAN